MRSSTLRKNLSLLLAAVITFSISGLTTVALAAGSDSGEVVHNGSVVNSSDGNVSVQKTAQKVSGENDTFDITLRVTTSDKVDVVTKETAAHVVLVIDTSGSMKQERTTNAKNAATAFVSTMLSADVPADNQVAVVTYSGAASAVVGLSDNHVTVNNKINNLAKQGEGGTNIQAGLQVAQGILASGHKDGVKDIILLLSDGQPTYSYRLTGTATWTGCYTGALLGVHYWDHLGDGGVDSSTVQITGTTSNQIGNGSNFGVSNNIHLSYTCAHGESDSGNFSYDGTNMKNGNHGVATLWQAGAAKATGTEIYSVLLMGSGEADYANASSVMQQIATDTDHYKSTGDMAALAALFRKISENITTPTSAGLVVDPMGDQITYVGLKNAVDSAAASFDGDTKTLTWDTSKSAPTGSGTAKTYTLTYRVKLNTAATNFVEDQVYSANGTTTFSYKLGEEEKTVNFDVPTVKGKTPLASYTIQYYLQGDATTGDFDHYTLNTQDTGSAKLHSTVTLPAGYENKYADRHYALAKADPASMVLGQNENVLKVYYKHVKVAVTVEHYLKTTTIDAYGVETVGNYEPITGTTVTATVNKGSSYTAAQLSGYTFDSVNPGLTVGSVLSDTTLRLYYSTTVD